MPVPSPLRPALLALLLAGCDGLHDDGRAGNRIHDTGAEDRDGDGWTHAGGDCDDADRTIYPGAPEVPYDGIDQDCDGADLTDVDGDRYDADVAGGDDCDDTDPAVHPGAPETTADGVDQDCDGYERCYEDGDGDGYGGREIVLSEGLDCTDARESGLSTDCDDGDPAVHPGVAEACHDGRDDDCDGRLDCEDGDCATDAGCGEDCSRAGDEEGDGLADCEDEECWVVDACLAVSRVRAGGRVGWEGRWDTTGFHGTGVARSVEGTLWLERYGDAASTCTWHVDRARFEGSYWDRGLTWSGSWATVSRTGFVLSPACPLPELMASFLPVPLPYYGRVGGWWSGWPSRTEPVHSWYAGPWVTLWTYHRHDFMAGSAAWSITSVETGDTFTRWFWPY